MVTRMNIYRWEQAGESSSEKGMEGQNSDVFSLHILLSLRVCSVLPLRGTNWKDWSFNALIFCQLRGYPGNMGNENDLCI